MLERYIDQTQTVSLVIKADMFQSLMFLYQQENLLNFFQNITQCETNAKFSVRNF